MDSPSFQYRLRFTDPDGIPQTLRFRDEGEARKFIAKLLARRPGTRVILERREARIGPWVQLDLGGGK